MTTIKNRKSIAVLGAGIIGINCAAKLQQSGYQVTLIDKNGIGEGCSERNAGHFATEQVFPLAEASLLWQLPKLLLDPLGPMALSPKYFPKAMPWFIKFMINMLSSKRSKNTKALKALNKNAIDYYKPLLNAADAEYLLTCQGSLLTFEETPLAQVKKHLQTYQNSGVAVKLLTREQVLAIEPNLSEKIQHALYFTDVAHTASPYQICKKLAELSISLGAKFQQFEVDSIGHFDSHVELSNHREILKFDHLVIATGAWSKSLLKTLGYKLPMEAERGYSLDLPEVTELPRLHRPVASAERKFIITPMAHGLRLSGTVEFAGLTAKANMQRADMLYQHAEKMLTEIADFDKNSATVAQRWLGCRPSLPDSLPVIGKAPKHNNITLALGHQHLGLTLGAITGTLVGQIINNEKTDIDISPFCLSRFN